MHKEEKEGREPQETSAPSVMREYTGVAGSQSKAGKLANSAETCARIAREEKRNKKKTEFKKETLRLPSFNTKQRKVKEINWGSTVGNREGNGVHDLLKRKRNRRG